MDRSTAIDRALALHRSGCYEEAGEQYAKLLRTTPHDAGLLHLLGLVRYQQGRLDEAEPMIREAIRQQGREALFHFNLGKLLADKGDLRGACAVYRTALELDPTMAAAYANLASALSVLFQHAEAIAAAESALRIDPRDVVAHEAAAMSCRHRGEIERARGHLRAAQAISGRPALWLKEVLLQPPMLADRAEIERVRERLDANLAALDGRIGAVADPPREISTTYFYLSYHGLCNRDPLRRLARLFLQTSPSLGSIAPLRRRVDGERIRVGFLSQFFFRHSIGKTSSGLIAQLDRSRFETHALFLSPTVDDDLCRAIRASADRSIDISPDLSRAREQIAALQLDVLFYQDIGMEPMSYFLAFSRLAPVQCVSFGHPDTTGIPNMDWFISSDLFEGDDGDSHYSERLFRLHDCGTLAYYYRPPASPPLPRSEFDLSEQGSFYLCPQTLFKFHPDFHAILIELLRRDPDGFVAIIEGIEPCWSRTLLAMLAAIDPDASQRVVVLPRMGMERFAQLVASCDMMLDTQHFNGMNTSLEAFATGVPVVTLPTALQRGRHTAGMYRAMGIAEAVAATPEEYVSIAYRLGNDPAARKRLSERILASNACLFENPHIVREFERFFEFALADAATATSVRPS